MFIALQFTIYDILAEGAIALYATFWDICSHPMHKREAAEDSLKGEVYLWMETLAVLLLIVCRPRSSVYGQSPY